MCILFLGGEEIMGYDSVVGMKRTYIGKKIVDSYLVAEFYPDMKIVKCRDCFKTFKAGDKVECDESRRLLEYGDEYIPDVICEKCYEIMCDEVFGRVPKGTYSKRMEDAYKKQKKLRRRLK